MPEILVTDDIEDVLVRFLRAEYTARNMTVSVATKLPPSTPRPAKFVRLIKVGGSAPSLVIRSARFVVDSYAPTETDASALAELTVALIASVQDFDGTTFYYRPDERLVSIPQNFPDPSITDRQRYTATVVTGIRAHAA